MILATASFHQLPLKNGEKIKIAKEELCLPLVQSSNDLLYLHIFALIKMHKRFFIFIFLKTY